jgi:uncharacterized membrane protein
LRIRAIDWLRGLVMLLMTVDHSGTMFDAGHLHGDTAAFWVPGSPLPAGEFLTRWVTHLCAPTFLLLAGASLALSSAKRKDAPGQTRFIVTRGFLIAALDPLWMGLAFAGYRILPLQVLYGIGIAMVCMAFLRKLPTSVIAIIAIAILGLDELAVTHLPQHPITTLLVSGGPVGWKFYCPYPVLPWLAIMMLGWVLGTWLLEPRPRAQTARTLALLGAALLVAFVVLRGIDGYGNMLHRDSNDVVQWLHVNKYPPSITFVTLELGIALVLLAGFMLFDNPRAFAPLALYGSTAFFFYLLHAHLMALAAYVLDLDPTSHGLAKTWIAAVICIGVLAYPCMLYRRYKSGHPDGWARYV